MLPALDPFVERWLSATPSERTHKHAFLRELCLALQVPVPDPGPGGGSENGYALAREVRFTPPGGAEIRSVADLYKVDCFVLQVKKDRIDDPRSPGPRRGRPESWHDAMERTRAEAVDLARSVERPPPFVVVCDVGRCFNLHACFDGSGRYRPFPDPDASLLPFEELGRHAETLRALWLHPEDLDPSKNAERVAGEAAASLASLAEALRTAEHPPGAVEDFVLSCLVVLFAEDFGLVPNGIFRKSLEDHWLTEPGDFPDGFARLWRSMEDALGGAGFGPARALPLREPHLRQLLRAASFDWSRVDPFALGVGLSRALDSQRARFSGGLPRRALVEALAQATVEAPLRADWDVVRAEVWLCRARGDLGRAATALRGFRSRLTRTRVLDPACGTGSFLCAALRFVQQLDAEVRAEIRALGGDLAPDAGVAPARLLGLEIDPRSVKVARLMIWLTYLRGLARAPDRRAPRAVLLPWELSSIESRDALLSWDAVEPVLDGKGRPVRLPRRGIEASGPGAASLEPHVQYSRPRKAEWPAADFIVGNPPFMGSRVVPHSLSEGYVAALKAAYPEVPAGADLTAYWWSRAATRVGEGAIRRFGFVFPNVLGAVTRSLLGADIGESTRRARIVLAAPDQPWDAQGLARVAMVVAQPASEPLPSHALLGSEDGTGRGVSYRAVRRIGPSLRAGPAVESVEPLEANAGLSWRGVWLAGSGFLVRPGEVSLERAQNPVTQLPVVRSHLTGGALMRRREGSRVIDFHGLSAAQAEALSPALFRRVLERVRPERGSQRRAAPRERWWQLGGDAPAFRLGVMGLRRYIATSQVAKHRVFVFLEAEILPDTTLACFALEDAHYLGVLSSRVHTLWTSFVGSRLADRSRYDLATCFQPFPFPACTELAKQAVRAAAEALDAHRKDSLAREPDLTLTEMYDALSGQGNRGRSTTAIAILRHLHDEVDRAVLDAYGWLDLHGAPRRLSDDEVLTRIVSLNRERAREEQAGLVRWLRPGFQGGRARGEDDTPPRPEAPAPKKAEEEQRPPPAKGLSAQLRWPATPSEQIACVRDLVAMSDHAWSTTEIASVFAGVKKRTVAEILGGLSAAGVLRASGPDAREPLWSLVHGGWT